MTKAWQAKVMDKSQYRALNEVYAIAVDVRGTRAWVRNEIKGLTAEGYKLMRLKLPDRVLKIEKIQPE